MSALPIIITTAGLQALVNAKNTGVSNVVIAAMGVSPNQVAVTAATTVIPGELKRINGVSGQVTAEDTIYVSAADQTQDTYTVRTVALYLSDGTLFAAYSQAAPLVEKAGPSQAVLEASVKLSAPLAGVIEFTGGGWLNPPASETVAGVLLLATVDEALAGVNHAKAVTPKGLKAVIAAMLAAIQATLDQINQAIAGKSNIGHQHAAADVTSGTFAEVRIPTLPLARITGLIDALAGKANSAHQHAAGDVTSGTFAEARIPSLPLARITGLIDALAEKASAIHSHTMAQVSGLIAALDAKASLGAVVRFASVQLGVGNGLIYGDADRAVVRAGPASQEKYFGFNADGSFQAYNGVLYSQYGRVWDPNNFDPATKATLGVNASFRDVIAGRNADDGVYYFGSSAGRWLAYSGGRYELIGAGGLTINGYQTWTAENFNPNLKANMASPSFTGTAYFGTDKRGQIWLMGGDDRAGVMEFRVDGIRYGFIGYGDGPEGNLYFGTDNGKAWIFTQRPSFAGYMPWDTANLAFASGAEVVAGAEHAKMVSPAGLFAFAKSLGASGYAVIPGTGLMVQWGVVSANISEGQTHAGLPTAFGGGCLVALATARNPTGNINSDYYMQVVGRYLDRIVFFANRANGSAGNVDGYEWVALGRVSGSPDPAYSAGGGGTGGGGGGGGGSQVEV